VASERSYRFKKLRPYFTTHYFTTHCFTTEKREYDRGAPR